MNVEHELFLTRREQEQRQKEAANERLARQLEQEAAERSADESQESERPSGAFSWFQRLTSAR